MLSSLCLARAFETETVWIMCNPGGDPLQGFMGGSGAWAPLRGRIGRQNGEAGLEVVEVDLSVLKVYRFSASRTGRTGRTLTLTSHLGFTENLQGQGRLESTRSLMMGDSVIPPHLPCLASLIPYRGIQGL